MKLIFKNYINVFFFTNKTFSAYFICYTITKYEGGPKMALLRGVGGSWSSTECAVVSKYYSAVLCVCECMLYEPYSQSNDNCM
jgi:hypothetical protein